MPMKQPMMPSFKRKDRKGNEFLIRVYYTPEWVMDSMMVRRAMHNKSKRSIQMGGAIIATATPLTKKGEDNAD